jgi:hypothetical protein
MRKHKRLLISLAALMCLFFLLWYFWIKPMSYIVDPAQVLTMKAALDPKPELSTFEVPREHIAPILAALRPFRVDPHPDKMKILGHLYLTCKGGRELKIHLYYEGAFSVDPQFEKRTYYRGGTDSAIEDAIRAAYQAKSP